jgi:hypothetical protein
VLGAVAANLLPGDPVWLGIIGPPSSAKTEILNSTSMLANIVSAATLTLPGLLYRVPEIVTRGRFPDGGESDSTWRTQEARHVGSDTVAPGF